MSTKSPVILLSGSTRKWGAGKQPIDFASSAANIEDLEEVEMQMKENKHSIIRAESVPHRCGSAPPSMEGSFQSEQNILSQKSMNMFENEERIRANPGYLNYYMSNVNLNPRLPPPLISRENRHLARRTMDPVGKREEPTLIRDDKSMLVATSSLDTHEEEIEDEARVSSRLLLGLDSSVQKSLVQRIQEDFPRTPSPIYNTRPTASSSKHVITGEAIDSEVLTDPLCDSGFLQIPSSSGRILNSHSSILKGQSSNASTQLGSEVFVTDLVGSTISEVESKIENLSLQSPSTSHSRMDVSNSDIERNLYNQHKHVPLKAPVCQNSRLYAPTAYMNSGNPFLPNLQSSSMISPQCSTSGYSYNLSMISPFFPGYTSHSGFPIAFDNSRIPNTSSVDLQHGYKFYGQPMSSFVDPSLYMHYSQHPQFDPFVSGGQFERYNEAKTYVLRNSGSVGVPSPRMSGAASPTYFGSPQRSGFMMMCGSPPIGSPVIPGSPSSVVSLRSGTSDRVSRGNDLRPSSFLDELKSNKARRLELSDISGHILEFSADQHGSRFIQQKLECCSEDDKVAVFKELLPSATTLITDVFGNYVIQKFFEHGNAEQRRQLGNKLSGSILPFSLQMYGCRVVQKALEVLEVDQKIKLVQELDKHVMRCVRDQNGNHVVQKCIECVPMEKINFIISEFRGQVATLSTHPYGCRVIQRLLEHISDEVQTECIINEILQSVCSLAQDQYGNYVTQHVLEKGKAFDRSQIIRKLAGQIVQMSQNKYASNVIEKCLEYGDDSDKEMLIQEIIGQSEGNDNLLVMMKDQYANYVVQKILETCSEKQRDALLKQIQVHLSALKKYTYGKHIIARMEHLCSESDVSEEPSGKPTGSL